MNKSLITKSILLFFVFFFCFSVLPTISSATWTIETLDAPKKFFDGSADALQRAIAIDSSNHPHIAYGCDNLYHAYFDGTTW